MAGFDQVIVALKEGKIAYREGWHGKQLDREMYIYINDPGDMLIPTPTGMKEAQPYVNLVINNQVVLGWLASQTDMIAEDWIIQEVV